MKYDFCCGDEPEVFVIEHFQEESCVVQKKEESSLKKNNYKEMQEGIH